MSYTISFCPTLTHSVPRQRILFYIDYSVPLNILCPILTHYVMHQRILFNINTFDSIDGDKIYQSSPTFSRNTNTTTQPPSRIIVSKANNQIQLNYARSAYTRQSIRRLTYVGPGPFVAVGVRNWNQEEVVSVDELLYFRVGHVIVDQLRWENNNQRVANRISSYRYILLVISSHVVNAIFKSAACDLNNIGG